MTDHLSRAASRERCRGKAEFQIAKLEMVANTGTYLDARPTGSGEEAFFITNVYLASDEAAPGASFVLRSQLANGSMINRRHRKQVADLPHRPASCR